jgi:hypothetical protein
MKDVKDEFIKGFIQSLGICPEDLAIEGYSCKKYDDCGKCWGHALRNIDITEREESK